MRRRISIKGRVRPSVRRSVGPYVRPVSFSKVKSTYIRRILCRVSGLVLYQLTLSFCYLFPPTVTRRSFTKSQQISVRLQHRNIKNHHSLTLPLILTNNNNSFLKDNSTLKDNSICYHLIHFHLLTLRLNLAWLPSTLVPPPSCPTSRISHLPLPLPPPPPPPPPPQALRCLSRPVSRNCRRRPHRRRNLLLLDIFPRRSCCYRGRNNNTSSSRRSISS